MTVTATVSGSITHQVAAHGVYAVFVLMAIDAVFPAASELVMLYAGALASGAIAPTIPLFGAAIDDGGLAFVVLALSGTLGYLAGALAGWWIGVRGGRPLLERHGPRIHLGPKQLARAERWFARWGLLGVLIGRITPLARSFISIPAGVMRMRLAPYAALTLVGSGTWAFAFAGAGWALGSRYSHADRAFPYVEYAMVALIVAAIVPIIGRAIQGGRSR
jgi:membrane protein DedA with SNARE-associated domain